MRINLAGCICASLAWALAAPSGGAEIRMGKNVAYPHVGLSLAVPENFTAQNTFEPYDVMRSVLSENDKLIQGVTVSVFPVDKNKTHQQFAQDMLAEMKKSLAVRHFKVIKDEIPLRIADKPSTGCTMQYTFRGIRTMAARVYFTRDVPVTGGRLCYVLTVEASAKHEASLLPVLDAVMKSLKLTTIRRPAEAAVSDLGLVYSAGKHGFSIRPPRGWYIAPLATGVEVAQTDYTAGGLPTATLRITVGQTPEGGTSKLLAQVHLARAAKAFPAAKTLWQGPVKLAGLDAWQFVLHQEPQTTTPPAGSSGGVKPPKPASLTIVQTVLCVPAAGERAARTYDLILLCHGGKADNIRATMTRIAPTFKLLGQAKVEPDKTGPTTKPSKTEPK